MCTHTLVGFWSSRTMQGIVFSRPGTEEKDSLNDSWALGIAKDSRVPLWARRLEFSFSLWDMADTVPSTLTMRLEAEKVAGTESHFPALGPEWMFFCMDLRFWKLLRVTKCTREHSLAVCLAFPLLYREVRCNCSTVLSLRTVQLLFLICVVC